MSTTFGETLACHLRHLLSHLLERECEVGRPSRVRSQCSYKLQTGCHTSKTSLHVKKALKRAIFSRTPGKPFRPKENIATFPANFFTYADIQQLFAQLTPAVPASIRLVISRKDARGLRPIHQARFASSLGASCRSIRTLRCIRPQTSWSVRMIRAHRSPGAGRQGATFLSAKGHSPPNTLLLRSFGQLLCCPRCVLRSLQSSSSAPFRRKRSLRF